MLDSLVIFLRVLRRIRVSITQKGGSVKMFLFFLLSALCSNLEKLKLVLQTGRRAHFRHDTCFVEIKSSPSDKFMII